MSMDDAMRVRATILTMEVGRCKKQRNLGSDLMWGMVDRSTDNGSKVQF